MPGILPVPQAVGSGWTVPGGTLRDFHPSEDLSELPPLVESVAGQGYHCRRIGSWRNSLPVLLWDEWGPLAALLAVFDAGASCTGGFWRILRIACPLSGPVR